MTLKAVGQLVVIVAVVALSLVEMVRARAPRTPPMADWERAREVIAPEIAPEHVVLFAPEWIEPVGRMMFGDRMPLATWERVDLATAPVVWEVSIRDAAHGELWGRAANEVAEFGGVRVRRFEQLAVAKNTMRAIDEVARLRRASGPAPVVRLTEVGFAARRCIEVVPPRGESVRLVSRVWLGTELVGGVGLADIFTRRDNRAAAQFAVEIDGHAVVSREVGVDDGWLSFAVATVPGLHEVAYTISAAAPDRRVCFLAEGR